jgi:hypothetical protein
MTETNKAKMLAEKEMAIAQRLGVGSQPVGESAEPTAASASNDEPGHDDQVPATDSVEPSAQDEPTGRAHDEHAPDDQVIAPVSIEQQIRGVLAEIAVAESRQKELKVQADAAYKEHVGGLHKEERELDRTILTKSYEVGAKLKAFKEKVGHGNFKKSVKPTFGKSHRWAVDYMELAEWRDRIESYAQQVGGAALLQVQSVRGAKRLLTELKEQEEFKEKIEATATNLVEERERDIDAGENPDEPVNEDADQPLDKEGKPRAGDDPAFVQRAVVRMGEIAGEYAGVMTKAQRRAFYVTITAEWLPQCDAETVARSLLKAWQPIEVEVLIAELVPGVKASDGDVGGLGPALTEAWELGKLEALRDYLDIWCFNKRAILGLPTPAGDDDKPGDQPTAQLN